MYLQKVPGSKQKNSFSGSISRIRIRTKMSRIRNAFTQAYLPDTSEGERALHGLYQAWTQRVLFTVGRSQTTGRVSVCGPGFSWRTKCFLFVFISVADPLRIWVQCGSGSSFLGSMRIWVQFQIHGLDDQKLKEKK